MSYNNIKRHYQYKTYGKTYCSHIAVLAGTLYKHIVKCDTDDVDNKVYVMQVKNGEVKMYWAYENYGADGKRIETIYDLQGRKLNGITKPGFYIVNGRKIYKK